MDSKENVTGRPQLIWVTEPENKIRFRYQSEGGSHGGLAGKTGKKTYPTLKLINYHGRKQISVRVCLYTEDNKEHVLDFKGKKHEGSKRYIEEKLQNDNTVEFKNLQIISKKKDEIEEILMEQKLKNLKADMSDPVRAQFEKSYRKDVKERAKAILNSVRLYFVAFENNRPNVPLCNLFSDVISNQKAAAKGDLRICRLSHVAGSWKGGEEIILLCEKVQKENIKVKFYEMDQHGNTIWQEYGHFSPVDVHYQYAIPFKTPSYKTNEEKKVFICLERNGEVSESREFTYKSDRTISLSKKRKLNNHQSETVPSPGFMELSENVSSPESDSNVEMQSMSNSNSDDSNHLEVSYGMLFGEGDLSTFNDLIKNVLDEDFPLPFDEFISSEDASVGVFDAFDVLEKKEQVQNPSLNTFGTRMPVATAQMYVPDIFTDKMTESNGIVGEMNNSIPINMDYINNTNYDLLDIDVALRDFTLKNESKNDSDSEFKNCYLNKLLQNGSKNLEFSEISLHKKKQIGEILLKRYTCDNMILHIAILMNKNIVPILKLSCITNVNLINMQNCKNQTPLHLAAERNKIKEVRILLQCGANPNLKDVSGNNCYHIAAKDNFFHVLQESNQFSQFSHNINDFNDEGLTPLHIAIMQNNSEHSFDLLKRHITQPNIAEKKAGKSLLHYAVHFQPSLLSKLLEMADIDVNIQDFEGNTPLHIACANESIETLKQLLQSGADPLIRNFKQNHSFLNVENSEDDAFDGQLPADLTTNIEILKLLRTATEAEVKDSLDLQNSDSLQGSDEIPSYIMDKLCRCLDDEMKWKKLVTYFCDADIVDSLSLSSSPTKTLLHYVKKQEQGSYLERFKTALEFAQLTDAVNIMNECL